MESLGTSAFSVTWEAKHVHQDLRKTKIHNGYVLKGLEWLLRKVEEIVDRGHI